MLEACTYLRHIIYKCACFLTCFISRSIPFGQAFFISSPSVVVGVLVQQVSTPVSTQPFKRENLSDVVCCMSGVVFEADRKRSQQSG